MYTFVVLCISQFYLRPAPPPATAGHLPALSVPRVGYLQILHFPGVGHLPTPGPFPSFWHARGFSYQNITTEKVLLEKTQIGIGSSVKDRNKLKRVVKACSRFYACISSLLIKIAQRNWSYRCESTFFGYWIKFLLTLQRSINFNVNNFRAVFTWLS